MIVEVLSPSTEDYDRGTKFHHYRRLGALAEYVLVSQDRRAVSVARRAGDLWAFDDVAGDGALALASLDLTIALDDLYRDAAGTIV